MKICAPDSGSVSGATTLSGSLIPRYSWAILAMASWRAPHRLGQGVGSLQALHESVGVRALGAEFRQKLEALVHRLAHLQAVFLHRVRLHDGRLGERGEIGLDRVEQAVEILGGLGVFEGDDLHPGLVVLPVSLEIRRLDLGLPWRKRSKTPAGGRRAPRGSGSCP